MSVNQNKRLNRPINWHWTNSLFFFFILFTFCFCLCIQQSVFYRQINYIFLLFLMALKCFAYFVVSIFELVEYIFFLLIIYITFNEHFFFDLRWNSLNFSQMRSMLFGCLMINGLQFVSDKTLNRTKRLFVR